MAILTRHRWRVFLACLCLAVFMPCLPAQAQNSLQMEEQKIKAGLIYNFLKYTQWPPEAAASSSLVVCIFSIEDPFSGYLQPIEDRTVNQRSISLRHISRIEDAANCHMLFVGNDEQEQWPALRRSLDKKSVLTVGDFEGFAGNGGMIEFDTKNNRVQIELNPDAASAAHLRIYENLRRLAKTTHAAPGGGEE
jgi:hypothetical protein